MPARCSYQVDYVVVVVIVVGIVVLAAGLVVVIVTVFKISYIYCNYYYY